MENYINNLFACLENNNYDEAIRDVFNITSIFSSELSTNLIDNYILLLLNEEKGILSFINKAVPKKCFNISIKNSLELIYTLINNFQTKFEPYIPNIFKTCKFIIHANTVSAEKQKALELIALIFETDVNIDDDIIIDVYNTLKMRVKMKESSKLVSERLVVAIGILVKRFSHIVPNEDEKPMLSFLLNMLTQEASLPTDKQSIPVITGLFTSISNYLYSFQDTLITKKLYIYLKQFACPSEKQKIKTAHRAALNLLTKHISLFSTYVYIDSKWWNNQLRPWLEMGHEDCKVGIYTLDAFHAELARIFVEKQEAKDKELFYVMLNRFQEDVIKTNTKGTKMRLSIKALGYFADACSKNITPNELYTLFVNLIQRVEHLFIKNTNTGIDYLENLPDYIQTLSNFIRQLDDLNEYHIISLQQVTILMIRVFPKLSKIYHGLVVDALVITMACMKNCKTFTLDEFLQTVIYQGVSWTCSHQLAIEAEITENTSYKTYMPLWKELLNILNKYKYDKYNIDRSSRSVILIAVFDELMKTLLVLINKLNLNTKVRDDTLGLTDPEVIFEAVLFDDFVIFVNVVDFYVEILEAIDPEDFRKWILMFTNQVMSKSLKYPLVSGFYKLLAIDLKICDKLNYFNEERVRKEHINEIFESFRKFIEDMIHKMKQYKGDLQMACLQVILEAPVYIINSSNDDFVSTFITIFKVGRSFLKIANLGVDTLEKWYKVLPQEKIEPFLKEVLPSLDSYLRTHSIVGNVDTSNPLLKAAKTKKVLSKRRVLVETEPELLNLQRKILTFIAKLNSELCWNFVNPDLRSKPLICNKTKHLKVVLPYDNCKFNLYLDKIIPRILELALYSSDRKTRFTACEMLHSSIMVILGTSVKMGDKSSELNPLLEKIAHAVLHLASGVDLDIHQLYYSLMFQLLHWYSSPKQLGSTQTEILLDILLEGITTPNESTVRDTSGKCINEFVRWSIKQSTKKSLETSVYNIEYIIKRLKYFSFHPDPSKRLGSALIFNNIYTEWREEELLVNMFSLDLLDVFITNLSMAQIQNFEENDCVIQVKIALDHILRVFVEKEQLFNKKVSIDKRPHPNNLDGNLLKDVATFLLKRTTSINVSCREQSMQMFLKIAPLVKNYNTTLFINEYKDLFFVEYEHILQKITKMINCKGIDEINKWFYSLLCLLDAHIFILKAKLDTENIKFEKSNLYKYLDTYFQDVQLKNIKDLFKNNPNIVITTSVQKSYDNLKTLVTEKILDLTSKILENKINIEALYFTPSVFNFLCNCTFDPSLGIKKIDDTTTKIINLISQKLSPTLTQQFVIILKEYISNKMFIQTSIKSNVIPQKQRSLLKGMLMLEKSELKNCINLKVYSIGSIQTIFEELLEYKEGVLYVKNLPKTVHEYCDLKIQLALENTEEFLALCNLLADTRIVKIIESNSSNKKYGAHIFDSFKQTIIKHLLKLNNFETFINLILDNIEIRDVYLYNMEVLKFCQKNINDINEIAIFNVINAITNNWDKFNGFFMINDSSKMTGIEFIEKLANLSKKTLKISSILLWVLNLIQDDQIPADFINQIINLLGFLLEAGDAPIVREALHNMKIKHFNNISSISMKIAVSLTIKKLFDAAKISKNINILIQAIDMQITIENDFELDTNIIYKTFLNNMNTDLQLTTLELMYNKCLENTYNCNEKIKFADNLCAFIRFCKIRVFEDFYKDKIIEIVDSLEVHEFDENILINKIMSYILIETLFSRIDVNKFEERSCPITDALFDGNIKTGKEMLIKLTKLSMNVCKTINDDLTNKETFRLYQCHAYKALISIICNTQKDIDFYNRLFNRENQLKEDILWNKLIDANKIYVFEQDFDELPERKKMLVNIRSELRQKNATDQSIKKSIKYLESQHLFNSTLSEDICKYDFTHTTIRSQQDDETSHIGDMEIEIESFDLCQHECMASVCGLVKHMFDNNITNVEDLDAISLPKWVKDLRTLLLNESTHKNIKLFFGRVIYNMRLLFKVYASWLIGPIVNIVVDGLSGNNLNSFVIDMIMMIINEWNECELLEEDKPNTSRLLKFIIQNVYDENRAKFKYNLDILKVVVELWKEVIIVPYDIILKELETPIKSKKLEVGIQISAILLANNVSPWETHVKQFAKSLIKSLDSTHRTVYKSGAETLSLSLKFIANTNQAQLDNLQKLICDKLNTISDSSKLAYCLEGLVNFYPEIADNFISKITFKMSNVVASFKAIYLRILLIRINKFHEVNGLLKINILDLLSDVSVDVQIITLEIILKSIDVLTIIQLEPILKRVVTFINNNNITCRNISYDILMCVYDRYHLSDDKECNDLVLLCKDFLLQALTENEPEIEKKIVAFWSNDDIVPMEIHNRFLYILENMYKVSTEDIYLGYSTYLLLNQLKDSDNFNDKIFDYPLYQCEFKDYELSTHWKAQHASMRPMFASTLFSQDSGESYINVLRATQTALDFEPTQNYVQTQRSEYLKNTSNSLLFTFTENADTTFKNPNDNAISQKYKMYNRRFYKDKSKDSKFFAYQEIEKHTKRDLLRKDIAKKKEVDIKVYRNYRTGEVPDIEISLSAIIIPLQVLAKQDAQIAKLIFVSLFDSILESVTDSNQLFFISKASNSISYIFTNSIHFTPHFMSALLEIALKYKKSMQFHPNTISTVCQLSGLMSIGTLLLEEYLIIGVDGECSTKRGSASDGEYEATHWIKLAELYKEMEEWDIVRAIFLEKLNCNETILTAIEAESVGCWKEAKDSYSEIIQSNTNLDKKDFYYESYFQCFAELSDWDNLAIKLEETVADENNTWEKMWDHDWNQQKLLPWYLKSEIRNVLAKPALKKDFLTNINKCLLDANKSDYLKSNFSEELAFIAIINNDTKTSKVYLESYISKFLDNYSHINPLFSLLRAKQIINMRNALDIYIFIKENNQLDPANYINILKDLEGFWNKSSIENIGSVIQNETRTIYRNQFIDLFKIKLENLLNDEDFASACILLDEIKFNLSMNLVDCSYKAENFSVAKKHMKVNSILTKLDPHNLTDVYLSKFLKYNLTLSKIFYLKGKQNNDNPQMFFEEAIKLVDLCLKNPHIKTNTLGLLSTTTHLYNITQEMCKNDKPAINVDKLNTIITNHTITTKADVETYGFNLIKKTLSSCEHVEKSDILRKHMAETFLKLAYYAQNKSDDVQMIYNTFKSMLYGSKEGILIFPNLLNLDLQINKNKTVFIEESSKIPIWMFIKWIPQLLSNLDSNKCFAIANIIINIAKEYPNSIIYAYTLSKVKYTFENNEIGEYCKEICQELDILLANDLVDTMLNALSSVSLYTNILRTALIKLRKACLKSEATFIEEGKAICKYLFLTQYNYNNHDSIRGKSFKKIDEYAKPVLQLLRDAFNQTKIRQKLDALILKIEKIGNPSMDLGFYSPWLKNYHPTDEEIEIPGQYKGNQRPLVQYHVKLAGFSPDIKIFNSLRKPIRITILGNNTREYRFLIKYGEDLRQDQRIEQLFNLMNDILSANPECCQRKLSIITYEVIPLTSKLGIIEWVDDTTHLIDFIKDGVSSNKRNDSFHKVSNDYNQWITKISPKENTFDKKYAAMMLKCNRDDVISKFSSFANALPWDAFRKSFWNVSADAESFFALRHKFITSYAVMCISNWLLGIGDRHLSNLLISPINGNAVGIDFGHAFGTATQIIGVPELVPFRLTPQIINLMQPYNEHGLLQETMIHALRALRENCNSLLATMNVFIQEPSMDWLDFAETLQQNDEDYQWFPLHKMELARNKFKGANPCLVMIEELKTRKNIEPWLLEKYTECVKGHTQHNIRARKGNDLTAEEQVKCLLDQATDYNLLGRMYLGWEPYI